MTTPHRIPKFSRFCVVAASSWCLVGSLLANDSWWNEAWTQRQNITLDTSGMADSIGDATVLVRLSEGRFNFQAAREDGSDIRFVAADGTTVLPHQVESYDGVLNEAFVWVRVPALKGGGKETIHLYYGNRDAAMPAAGKPTDVYGKEISAVHHFGQAGRAPMDATANANHAAAPATTAESAIIGNGLRLLGNNPVTIPNSATLAWTQGQDLTLQLWLKPAALQDESVVFSRSEGTSSLRLILNQGVPAVEITDGSSRQRSQAGSALPAAAWHHLAVVAGQGKVQLLVDGEPYASLNAVIPALVGPIILGAAEPAVNGLNGFTGEMDEFRIQASALSTAAVRFAAANQGLGEDSARVVVLGEIEGGESGGGGSKALEHVLLFGDIAKNMMFDGWIAVGLCMVMIVIGWTVAIRKFFYLNQIEKGNREFLKLWKSVSTSGPSAIWKPSPMKTSSSRWEDCVTRCNLPRLLVAAADMASSDMSTLSAAMAPANASRLSSVSRTAAAAWIDSSASFTACPTALRSSMSSIRPREDLIDASAPFFPVDELTSVLSSSALPAPAIAVSAAATADLIASCWGLDALLMTWKR